MNDFYLLKSGTLKRKDSSLILITEEKEISIPIEQVNMIFCFAELTLNKRVLELLSKYQIGVMFFDYYGRLIGRFCPEFKQTGKVIIEQVSCYQSHSRRVEIARTIQLASIENMLSVMKYYHKKGLQVSEKIQEVEVIESRVAIASTVDEILIHEAQIKKIYYGCFDQILKKTPFEFQKRTTSPPLNSVNSMMSFGYHLLYGMVLMLLDMSQLTPDISYIHSDSVKGPGLHLDLADIYKPIFVDKLIFRLLRRGTFSVNDFEQKEAGVYLTRGAQKVFVTRFQEEMAEELEYSGRKMTRKSIIRNDIYRLQHYVVSDDTSLRFFHQKW